MVIWRSYEAPAASHGTRDGTLSVRLGPILSGSGSVGLSQNCPSGHSPSPVVMAEVEARSGSVLPPMNAANELSWISANDFAQLDELTDFEAPFPCLEL